MLSLIGGLRVGSVSGTLFLGPAAIISPGILLSNNFGIKLCSFIHKAQFEDIWLIDCLISWLVDLFI